MLVAQRLESERETLSSTYAAQEAELLAKIAALEQQAAAAKPAGKK